MRALHRLFALRKRKVSSKEIDHSLQREVGVSNCYTEGKKTSYLHTNHYVTFPRVPHRRDWVLHGSDVHVLLWPTMPECSVAKKRYMVAIMSEVMDLRNVSLLIRKVLFLMLDIPRGK